MMRLSAGEFTYGALDLLPKRDDVMEFVNGLGDHRSIHYFITRRKSRKERFDCIFCANPVLGVCINIPIAVPDALNQLKMLLMRRQDKLVSLKHRWMYEHSHRLCVEPAQAIPTNSLAGKQVVDVLYVRSALIARLHTALNELLFEVFSRLKEVINQCHDVYQTRIQLLDPQATETARCLAGF